MLAEHRHGVAPFGPSVRLSPQCWSPIVLFWPPFWPTMVAVYRPTRHKAGSGSRHMQYSRFISLVDVRVLLVGDQPHLPMPSDTALQSNLQASAARAPWHSTKACTPRQQEKSIESYANICSQPQPISTQNHKNRKKTCTAVVYCSAVGVALVSRSAHLS